MRRAEMGWLSLRFGIFQQTDNTICDYSILRTVPKLKLNSSMGKACSYYKNFTVQWQNNGRKKGERERELEVQIEDLSLLS